MQFKTFKSFIWKVLKEGDRLQKSSIDGTVTTKSRFTNMQVLAIVVAIISIFLLKKGFTENFAGFIIGFLGIFIGLFASIVISTFDSKRDLMKNDNTISSMEIARLKKVKNYLVQFTGLTSYSILIATILILLLLLVLLNVGFNSDIFEYKIVDTIDDVSYESLLSLIKVLILTLHRFFTVYLLIMFFTITIYSITSYFSFLQSEYKKPYHK